MLRLDWNILFDIVNLILLYILMKRFLFKPVNEIIAKRQAEADGRFARADEREAQARASQEKYERLLSDAEGEREQIVAKARREASREYGRIVDEAKLRADELTEKAKKDAENEKKVILQQADSAVQELVVAAAAKMVGAADGAERDRALYDQFLGKAGS